MVRIWDTHTGTSDGEPLRGHDGAVTGVAYSPDGKRLVSASYEGTVRIWSLMPDRHAIKTHAGGLGCPLRAAVSPDGNVHCGCQQLRWRPDLYGVSRTQIGDHTTHVQGNVRSAAFSPTASSIVAATSRETITLFDVVAGRAIRSIVHGHVGGVDAISFSSDGKRLVTGGIDRRCASGMWKRALPSARRCRVIKRSRSVSCSFPTGPSSRRAAMVASCVGMPTPVERLAGNGVGRGSEVSR